MAFTDGSSSQVGIFKNTSNSFVHKLLFHVLKLWKPEQDYYTLSQLLLHYYVVLFYATVHTSLKTKQKGQFNLMLVKMYSHTVANVEI